MKNGLKLRYCLVRQMNLYLFLAVKLLELYAATKYEEPALGEITLQVCPVCLCLANTACRVCSPFARNQISDLKRVHSATLIGTIKKLFRG